MYRVPVPGRLSKASLSVQSGKSPSMRAVHRIHFKGYSSPVVVGGLAREMCSVPEVCFPVNSSFQKGFSLSLFNVYLWDHPILDLEGPQRHHCQKSPGNE